MSKKKDQEPDLLATAPGKGEKPVDKLSEREAAKELEL